MAEWQCRRPETFGSAVRTPVWPMAAVVPPPASTNQDSNRRPKILRPSALPFDRRSCDCSKFPHCLEPSERKLLTPPPTPPLKKVLSSFRG